MTDSTMRMPRESHAGDDARTAPVDVVALVAKPIGSDGPPAPTWVRSSARSAAGVAGHRGAEPEDRNG